MKQSRPSSSKESKPSASSSWRECSPRATFLTLLNFTLQPRTMIGPVPLGRHQPFALLALRADYTCEHQAGRCEASSLTPSLYGVTCTPGGSPVT
eukprot:CAMPEP_0171080702 /NCGR_PEP_ID=MMETSP0766_2-20121228/16029_1 /TAXON_ID=439317 /ORGANISM="Gambierdiscus australes, Strain CAWD 149" /LENGTH=94 /DNA_ID=CAMNT_0011537961 /DNA_START=100 /DNA_END=384 /DNA_ORIENTATION=-